MPRFRLARPAEADIARILRTSEERWGSEAKRHYAAIIAAGMRKIANDPKGPTTRNRSELSAGIRSFHLRHARGQVSQSKVRHPVHIFYYRIIGPDLIEIVRVLHERMEPTRHIGRASAD